MCVCSCLIILAQDILIALLRLRKCSEAGTFRPELLGGCSIVRELHVYGTAVPVHARDPAKFQHQVFDCARERAWVRGCVYSFVSACRRVCARTCARTHASVSASAGACVNDCWKDHALSIVKEIGVIAAHFHAFDPTE